METIVYSWVPGSLASPELIEECALLYSSHYGMWSSASIHNPGQRIRLTARRLREWIASKDSRIALARAGGELVGYAIAVQTRMKRRGIVSWVTQFVVHEAYRNMRVGTRLLFAIWEFTDHFAWGLTTANPYAIRALEKATRRRCDPSRISKTKRQLLSLGSLHVPYMHPAPSTKIGARFSRVNTNFFVDHSTMADKLAHVTNHTPWTLGSLEEGWEWFAFTFHDQPQIGLSRHEIEAMLATSDDITRGAYSRMALDTSHQWMRHSEKEVQQILEYCELSTSDLVFDFGCGTGRHALGLAASQVRAVGIDYIPQFVSAAKAEAERQGLQNVDFLVGDCRTVELGQQASVAICLYDVIGTYANDVENRELLQNVVRHVRPGGRVLLSVMNGELTERRAIHWFSLHEEPDALLQLKPSRTMERTGNVFDPELYMVDRTTRITYRKEQFAAGTSLPAEVIVRDRRFLRNEIEAMCRDVGLSVIWSRLVRAGRWEVPLGADDNNAKEILVLGQRV